MALGLVLGLEVGWYCDGIGMVLALDLDLDLGLSLELILEWYWKAIGMVLDLDGGVGSWRWGLGFVLEC